LKNIITAIILALFYTSLLAEDVQKTKEFPDLKCKLTLPSSDFLWLDNKMVPDSKAVLRNNSGIVMLLMVFKIPFGQSINESFIKDFDSDFCQGGRASKISGGMITFKNAPCYQLLFRMKQGDSCGVGRIFLANGYVYSLQVVGGEELIKNKAEWEKLFSAFEFTSSPSLPSSVEQKAYKFGYMMGRIAFYCIVIALIVGVVALSRRAVNRKKKDS
jgi:hypothetical protein